MGMRLICSHLAAYIERDSSFRDKFYLIFDGELLPPQYNPPAEYAPCKPIDLKRDSKVEDICDFLVQYLKSDVLVRTPYAIAPLWLHNEPNVERVCCLKDC